jgi:hypothetical protein
VDLGVYRFEVVPFGWKEVSQELRFLISIFSLFLQSTIPTQQKPSNAMGGTKKLSQSLPRRLDLSFESVSGLAKSPEDLVSP